jgi:hypothetical protein
MDDATDAPQPLTPALLRLLQACVDERTLDERRLGEVLDRSPKTIHTQFARSRLTWREHEVRRRDRGSAAWRRAPWPAAGL